MIPNTPADVTGDAAIHTLASVLGVTKCKWFQVTAVSIASTAARVGNVSIALGTQGIPVASGGGVFAPPIALAMDFYDLTKWYYIAASSDVVSISCGM